MHLFPCSFISANHYYLSVFVLQEGPRSHARRDLLLQIQKNVQAQWEKDKVFEATADGDAGGKAARKKFFGNFPYPYMNGLLHLGHAFTLSKVGGRRAPHHIIPSFNILQGESSDSAALFVSRIPNVECVLISYYTCGQP